MDRREENNNSIIQHLYYYFPSLPVGVNEGDIVGTKEGDSIVEIGNLSRQQAGSESEKEFSFSEER